MNKLNKFIFSAGLFSLWLLAGCASAPLAGPTTSFVAGVTQAQNTTVEINNALMASDLTREANLLAANPSLEIQDYQPFISSGNLAKRVMVLQGLLDYATALKNLANLNVQTNTQTAADNLVADLNSTTNSIKTLTGQNTTEITGICDALVQVGSFVVQGIESRKRDDALKYVLENNQNNINDICGILAREMDSKIQLGSKYNLVSSVIYDELDTDFSMQERALHTQFQSTTNNVTKLTISTAFVSLLQKRDFTLKLCTAAAELYKDLADAHNALMQQAKNGVSSKATFDTLATQIKIVSLYLDQLKTIGVTNGQSTQH